jgi:hypothetical protein
MYLLIVLKLVFACYKGNENILSREIRVSDFQKLGEYYFKK